MENHTFSITTTLYQPQVLKQLVEKLAQLQSDIGYCQKEVEPGWVAVETSTITSYVNGDIHLSDKNEIIHIPFVTCFLYTCQKTKGENYSFAWGSSLS